MSEIKRIDGHKCDEGCYNYRTFNGVHYCHGISDAVTIKANYIYFGYRVIDGITPLVCPLGRVP